MLISDATNQPIEIFFSYSHPDETFREELKKHLRLLERAGFIKGWHDRNISAGTEWKNAIDEKLESAEIILLLVSANFIDSDYCYEMEMKRAMERHNEGSARVIPIILRSCRWWGAPFGKLQALPEGGKPIETWERQADAYTSVTKGIERVIAELNPSILSNCPLPNTNDVLSPIDPLVIKEFNELKLRILLCFVDPTIGQYLSSLRDFLFKNPSLLARRDVIEFYQAWIAPKEMSFQAADIIGRPVALGWTKSEWEKMREQLGQIVLR